MADGSTTNFGITLPENTGSDDTWGIKTNSNWSLVDKILGSVLSKSVAGSSNVSLSDSECQNGLIILTGELEANIEVQPVAKARRYIVYNNTTGAFSLTFKPSGATGPVLPRGKYSLVYCDGTNCAVALESYSVSSFIETLLDDADAATARATLGLGGLATKDAVGTSEITDESVTLAKLQHIASARLLGRSTAGDGDPEQITIGSGLQLSGGALACTVTSKVVKVASTVTGATATGNTAIPADDTIPQITEGTQFMSLAFTPTNASNLLRIDVVFYGQGTSNVGPLIVALFKNGTSNALAAGMDELYDEANYPALVSFTHWMTAGSASAMTFSVRAGAPSGTIRFNGAQATRFLGGVLASSITITEYEA